MMDFEIFEKKIIYCFQKYEINCNDAIINNFYIFTKQLLSENEKYNLTSLSEIDEIIIKHYIDSVLILKYFEIPKDAKIIDIGTGAGFPALPLYIMRNDLQITFLDSTNKKINFIKNTAEQITGNKKFIYHSGRAEQHGKNPKIRETYDIALMRAVAKLSVLCELAAPYIHPEGFFVAYKGKNAENEIFEAQNAIKILGLKITETAKFDLEDNKRTLIKIQKLNKTPLLYPRQNSEIIKNPL